MLCCYRVVGHVGDIDMNIDLYRLADCNMHVHGARRRELLIICYYCDAMVSVPAQVKKSA